MKKTTWIGALALAALAAHAAVSPPAGLRSIGSAAESAEGADATPAAALGASGVRQGAGVARLSAAAPTVDDVGDADSFGRSVRWLGLRQANIELMDTCPPDPVDGFVCQPLAPSGVTSFAFTDVARFVLPAKASRSLLCHWFSPYVTLDWSNPGTTPVLGTLTYSPTLTVENPVLDDPSLINPQTGLPFGGSLVTGMSATERHVAPLAPGMAYEEIQRDTATCIAGFISRAALVNSYGLTEAQADAFFRQPMGVRLNVRGSASHLAAARLILGLRIVGD